MKEIDLALIKLSEFFEATAFNYAKFAKEIQKNPKLTRFEKDKMSSDASDKVIAAATPVIDFIVKAQSATTKLEKQIVDLQRKMDAMIKEEEEFSENMRKECTIQVDECNAALEDARRECKPKASEMPQTIEEAQSNAAANLTILQTNFDAMVNTFQAEADQREKALSIANARAERFEKQLQSHLRKAQSENTDSQNLALQITAMQSANKELQQQIKLCRLETMQIQTLQERVQEAETEYGACEADRGKLRQRLAQLSERLEELQNTSGQIVSGEFLEGSGKGEYKFPRPPKQRRGSGVLQ